MSIKLLGDYTGAELETLTDEQVQRIVDLECAERGQPLAPTPVQPLEPFKHDYDVKVYAVGKTGLHVASIQEAEGLARAIRAFQIWSIESSWKHNYQSYAKLSDDPLEITPVEGYSLPALDARKDALNRHKEVSTSHEKEVQSYDKAIESRGAVSEFVWRIVQHARDFHYERERLSRELKRYVELAEGSGSVGLRFFEKAYPVAHAHIWARVRNGELSVRERHYLNPENRADIEVAECVSEDAA